MARYGGLFRKVCWFSLFLASLPVVLATYRYYSLYLPYGSGDTILSTQHAHGGPVTGHRKWICECMDGEAMVGINDWVDDYERLQAVWCRFMFPNKPASQGAYPYFPTCHVRDYFYQFFCFAPQNASGTINTFVTGIWDNDPQFYTFRPGTGVMGDAYQPYKCCKTPDGYYIDYVSCYYMPFRDQYFEYYDSPFYFLVACNTGYVITGISKKQNPYENEWHPEWLQCCRVGYGPPSAQESPLITSASGRPAYTGSIQPATVSPSYRAQYRILDDQDDAGSFNHVKMHDLSYLNASRSWASNWDFRYKRQPIPASLTRSGSSAPLLGTPSYASGGRSASR